MLAKTTASTSRATRSQSGLTTLEWLLIVAAVAGLAALAVVLVQNVVDETAEEISGNNARITAAQVAAARITSDARSELPTAETSYMSSTHKAGHNTKQSMVNSEYSSKCNRLAITYSDAEVKVMWFDAVLSDSTEGTTQSETSTVTGDISEEKDSSGANKRALCEVDSDS